MTHLKRELREACRARDRVKADQVRHRINILRMHFRKVQGK